MNASARNAAAGELAVPLPRTGWAAERRRHLLYGLIPAVVVLLSITVAPAAYLIVTSFTPLKYNPGDPVALAVGGTAATGYTGAAEGTDAWGAIGEV